ncbi:oligogalacturonate-specific porin KdgM family protein [Vibrio makurazakiensis]|uniref:hypothetical protein n=1 Tax=Vibrio makurazakiensis TaxID=2910250 RepID=UPI003D153055
MKKLAVATAVLASLTASTAFAEITVDVYGDRSTKSEFGNKSTQGIELGYGFDNGFGLSAEATTNKDLDLGASWKIETSESSYLKPSIGYVFKDTKTKILTNPNPGENAYEFQETSGMDSNVVKIGLESGVDYGSWFTAARVRYEANTEKLTEHHEIGTVDSKGNRTATYSHTDSLRSETARLDFTLGYRLDAVTLTAKGINKIEINKDLRRTLDAADIDRSRVNYEFKATVTAYDGVAPYVQFAINDSGVKGVSDDHVVKIGTKFSF